MKNLFCRTHAFASCVFVFVLLVSFTIPHVTFATSGACSYHGGVACSLGADSDGSVICADGWRDSSVSFSDMTECHSTPIYCSAPSISKQDCGSVRAQMARGGQLGSPSGDAQIDQCESQNQQYDAAQTAYQQCLSSQANIQEQQWNSYVQQNQQQQKDWQVEEQVKYNSYCEDSQGIGSKWVGEFGPQGSCQPTFSDFAKSCQSKMGSNATYIKSMGMCLCYSGYMRDENNQCVAEKKNTADVVIPENNTPQINVPPVVKTKVVIPKTIIRLVSTSTATSSLQIESTTTPIRSEQKVSHKGWLTSVVERFTGFFTYIFRSKN